MSINEIITNNVFEEFKKIFSDHNSRILNYLITIFKKNYETHPQRITSDMLRLIDYKKNNPNFMIVYSLNDEDEYNPLKNLLEINVYNDMAFNHELSHIMFEIYENESSDKVVEKFNLLRLSLLNHETMTKVKKYLNHFHQQYDRELERYRKSFKEEIAKKYKSFDNYVKSICKLIIDCKTTKIKIGNFEDYIIESEEDAVAIALELIRIEKEEYANSMVRHKYAAQLMIENLIDAICLGKIYDGFLDNVICLSGHSSLYFMEDEKLSLNECIADYDALKKIPNNHRLIENLHYLIGNEMIEFLDNYIVKNRENNYGR